MRHSLPAATVVLAVVAAAAADAPLSGLEGRALAGRSGPHGATLFVEVPAVQTGLVSENRYDDPRMWGEWFQEFKFGAIGSGVAVGDYDADGRPDVYVVSKTERGRLFRNLGDWRFEDVTEQAGLATPSGGWLRKVRNWIGLGGGGESDETWTQGATFVDVNNDGWLDVYICRFDAPNLLYVNQGDASFREEAAARGLALDDASGMAAFCDYDRDGWLDVYVQTNLLDNAASPTGQPDYLLRNNGDGTFTDVTGQAGVSGATQGHSATWWDYDNDGWPDLYVANDFAPPDFLYHNNRDGTFTEIIDRVVPYMPHSAMGADLGDVDNDGLIDFLVADMAATTHEKDQRGMAGIRDLLSDLVVEPDEAPQHMRNTLFLNTNTGHVLEAAQLAGLEATDWTWSVRFEDLDNDGRLDLHVTNGMVRELHNADLVRRLSGSESMVERVNLEKASPVLAEANLAYRNLGDLRFEEVGANWGLDEVGVSFGAACGDFDGDGDLDLVYSNYERGVTLLRNDSQEGHRVVVALRGTRSNRFGVGATVRIETASGVQVRQLVLARGYLSSSEPILHFGLGDDARIERLTVEWPSGETQAFTDLAADRHYTITEESTGAPAAPAGGDPLAPQFVEMSEALNLSLSARERVTAASASSRLQPLLPVRFERRGPALAVGDFNGDGAADLVLGATTAEPARIVAGSGSGRFNDASALTASGGSTPRVPMEDGPLLVFDANGDGADDVLVTKAGTSQPAGAPEYQPVLWLNDGAGALQRAPAGTLPALPISVGAAVAADFDRDGRLDLFLGGRVVPGRYPLPARSALLINRGGGRFEEVTGALAPGLEEVGLVSAALWSDVDGDDWIDLLVALEWGGVRYWRNEGGQRFVEHSEEAGFAAAGTGWWTALAAADFNGDGRPDYVAGNVGLNTPYQASEEEPALLYYGDFKGGGAALLIEAYYEGDRLYPRRTSKVLGAQIPAIRQRFRRNDEYARATLEEIVGADRLAGAQRFAATQFNSGVFLSGRDGRFRFAALPRMAQIAPWQGVVAGDFDGDGHADIYAVHNSHAPIPPVGRFAGGLSQLLRGDGTGNFTAVPPAESGLVVPGDAKALVVLDLEDDGRPDFVVTRNHAPTLVFRNQGGEGSGFLRVGLRGTAGNPTAVGARVTVELADGSSRSSEVYAGSGYYSQSTPALFFGHAAANPPRSIRVRWPSGATSAHAAPAAAPAITLSAPDP